MRNETDKLAKIIWDYHHLNHKITPCDLMLVFGSNDTRTAERAAELLLTDYASIAIVSGNSPKHHKISEKNHPSKRTTPIPEAIEFSKIMIDMGVEADRIITETKATNSEHNVRYSEKIAQEKELKKNSILIVQKPFMERRAYATFKNFWTDSQVKVKVTSPNIPFEDYPNEDISKETMFNLMVGDLYRIKVYPDKGFQIPQDIPDEVWDAFLKLIDLGYTQHIPKDEIEAIKKIDN